MDAGGVHKQCGAQLHVVMLVEIQIGFSSRGRGDLDQIIDCFHPRDGWEDGGNMAGGKTNKVERKRTDSSCV